MKDEPVLSDPQPAKGAQTGDEKRPEISVALTNAGKNPAITMTVGGKSGRRLKKSSSRFTKAKAGFLCKKARVQSKFTSGPAAAAKTSCG